MRLGLFGLVLAGLLFRGLWFGGHDDDKTLIDAPDAGKRGKV
jgi:hypothetical protein